MKPDQLVTLAVSLVLGLGGWLAGYATSVLRDRLSKRRDLRVQYLLEAYRRLEDSGNRATPRSDDERQLESAIADIQLLGSPEQASLARQFALEFATSGQASLDPLLESLRGDLRRELRLEEIPGHITYLRITSQPGIATHKRGSG